jgi:hypothetical protein
LFIVSALLHEMVDFCERVFLACADRLVDGGGAVGSALASPSWKTMTVTTSIL